MKPRVLFIQPIVAHYRSAFYDSLLRYFDLLVLIGRNDSSFETVKRDYVLKVWGIKFFKFEFFNVFKEIKKFRPDIVVSYGEVKQLANFMLLFIKFLSSWDFIIWSHGFKTEHITLIDRIRLLLMRFSDGVIFYTERCNDSVLKYGLKNTTYINNTLKINKIENNIKGFHLDDKITTKINGIFVARFSKNKNPEQLLNLMIKIHNIRVDIGFIVVGDGLVKPDFSKYTFIYDYGRIYNEYKKSILFQMANFSLMPSGIGLSIVECFAHGIPMITYDKSCENIKHGVEFNYLENNINGFVAKSEKELLSFFTTVDTHYLSQLGFNAKNKYLTELSMEKMVIRTVKYLNAILND